MSSLVKYRIYWTGFDAGREGLWKDPIWMSVLSIIARHEGEAVYDSESPIYLELESLHPGQAWRSQTSDGDFRPLFRDYPNSWTRTGVVSLDGKKFWVTPIGKKILSREYTRSTLLADMFRSHSEMTGPRGTEEKPFAIVVNGLLNANRPLSTSEIYWAIMKNYRPGDDRITDSMRRASRIVDIPETTPYRRLRSMLTLMRTAGVLISSRRGPKTFWTPTETALVYDIARIETK